MKKSFCNVLQTGPYRLLVHCSNFIGYYAERQTANLLAGQRSAFSLHCSDLLHRFMWNLALPRGTWVRLAEQNFMTIGERGWERGPQYGKNFHFLVKCCPQGRTLWSISTIVRAFMLNYPALVFYIWDDSLHWLRSYCWETARQSFTPNFSVHPVGKTALDRKWFPPF